MLTLRYLGHAAFSLDDGEREVLVDPFISGNPKAVTTPEEHNPSTILITHAHNDHVGDAVDLAKRTGAKIITVVELADHLEGQGAECVGANHGGTVKFDGGTVKFVPAWHSSSFTRNDGSTVAPGVPAGLVVRFGGQTIYFAGDTALFRDMDLIGEEGLDAAVLPIGDHFTMGPDDALRAVKLLKPKIAIPCHYNTFPVLMQDEAKWGREVEEHTESRAVVLAPGETHTFGS